MRLLLDTDICIYAINNRATLVVEQLRRYSVGDVGNSGITFVELRYGVENSADAQANSQRLVRFLLPLEILPFDEAAGRQYGALRVALRRKDQTIGSNDMLIAAHALSLDTKLAANNVRESERVDGLRVERRNWSATDD